MISMRINGSDAAPELNTVLSSHAPAPSSDAVDTEMLASLADAQVEGEPDLIVELIDLYLADATDKLLALEEAFKTKGETRIKRIAHGLRGSSGSLGVRRVAALCEQLERANGCDSWQRIEWLLASLRLEFELARQSLAVERRKRSRA